MWRYLLLVLLVYTLFITACKQQEIPVMEARPPRTPMTLVIWGCDTTIVDTVFGELYHRPGGGVSFGVDRGYEVLISPPYYLKALR